MKVLCDFETRSEAILTGPKSVGAWKYAEHPSTKILCMSWRIDDGPIELWTPDQPFPKAVKKAVWAGATFEAHGAQFEKAIWWFKLCEIGVPYPSNWECTLAVCAYRALPQALDKAGDVLNLPVQKDKRGKYLIQRLCKRHKPSKKWPTGWVDPSVKGITDKAREEAEALYQELYEYCKTDNEAEGVLSSRLGGLPVQEQLIWTLDQAINERGVRIDLPAVAAARRLAEMITAEMTAELVDITNGRIKTVEQTAKIVEWCHENSAMIPNMQADTITEWLQPSSQWINFPPHVRRVLEIRQEISKSSIKKLDAMERWVMSDGHVRGMYQYHASLTGRFAGRGPQPQNMPRPEFESEGMEYLMDIIKNPMIGLSDALRGMFIADEGKTFQTSDFGAIEARIGAWMAGEEWKLQAFEAGEQIYCKTAKMIFGYPVDKYKNPKEYTVGKICELAFGYQGALGAWRGFDNSDRFSDDEVFDFCRMWRKKHPGHVDLWAGLERAAGRAVTTGNAHSYGNVTYEPIEDAAGKWLKAIMPNGSIMWYLNPGVEMEDTRSGVRYHISYDGRDNKRGGSWNRVSTYGGKLMENADQKIARELLVDAMIRVEYASYPIVMTAHDEIVAEVPKDFGSQEELNALMSIVPEWAPGLPLVAEGWRGDRYHK